jgi:phage terminase large subunit
VFQATTATRKIANLSQRLRVIAGGTSASKTISILLWLIDRAQSTENELISVVSETFPHLKRGAMRDFLSIMESNNYYKDKNWNRTDCIYTFETGSRIEFFSADQPGKVRGPRRDILFINEANNIGFEQYDQLAIRTKKLIFLDYNPTHEFWFYTDVAPHYEHDFLTLTYKDNEALDAAIIQDIESHKHNKNWWLVYGLGQLGEIEARIYTGWITIDEIPHEARLERRGLDFGYSQDPASLIDIYRYNGGLILDERFYKKGMSNKDIADYINNSEYPDTVVYADSAEPKSIDEISTYGVTIQAAHKGQGSINHGIQYLQDQRVSMTNRSVNLIKEYRNYLWETDKDGKIIPKAQDFNNHALDAVRYAVESLMYATRREAGIVTPRGIERKESFTVDENGDAPELHHDLQKALNSQREDDRSWMYR